MAQAARFGRSGGRRCVRRPVQERFQVAHDAIGVRRSAPQHLQQQDRYLERYIENRCHALRSHTWGVTELELERDLLAIHRDRDIAAIERLSR